MTVLSARCVSLPCLFLLASAADAQDWIKNFGTSGTDYVLVLSRGDSGSAYVGGITDGRFGQYQHGGWDGFAARRHDLDGDLTLALQIGSEGDEQVRGLAPDGVGGVYITGSTNGELGGYWFGGFDAWVAHYDGAGNQLWFTRIGSSGYDSDEPFGIAADDTGVFVVGATNGDLGGPPLGNFDTFVARFSSSSGDLSWVAHFGTPEIEETRGIAVDGSGGVFVGGWTAGSLAGPNAGGKDAFLIHCDQDGQATWSVQLGSESTDVIYRLAADGEGGVALAGSTGGSLGGPNLGHSDVLLAHYSMQGHPLWTVQFGTERGETAWGLDTDGSGGWLVAGETSGDWFGLNAGIVDGFLVRCDAEGRPTGAQFGTEEQEDRVTTSSDGLGGAFVAGFTSGDFGGKMGGFDGFVGHFTPQCATDIDGSGTLDLFDFLAFVNLFNAADPLADCDGSDVFDLFDFLCFVNAFNAGC